MCVCACVVGRGGVTFCAHISTKKRVPAASNFCVHVCVCGREGRRERQRESKSERDRERERKRSAHSFGALKEERRLRSPPLSPLHHQAKQKKTRKKKKKKVTTSSQKKQKLGKRPWGG